MTLAIREALIGFRRAPILSFLSVTTIAFSLFAFGLFSLVAMNLRDALAKVESRVEIRAFVQDGTEAEVIVAAMEGISGYAEVARVEYVSPEQAFTRAREELPEFQDVFEAGFLPASLDIQLRDGSRDPETVAAIAAKVRDLEIVDDVRFGEEWIQKLHTIKRMATMAGIVLGLVFAAVAIIIIAATIRMAVMARTREISIMRLVGATDGFIRLPFLLEGVVKGILGGALALLLTWIASRVMQNFFSDAQFFAPHLAMLGLIGGAMIGGLGSAMSVAREIRKVL